MKRVLIDTSIYVDWFRAREHQEIVAGRHGPPSLSAVVAMELLGGAKRHERLARWTDRFRRAGRLLVPEWQVYRLSAYVLRVLRGDGVASRDITNDVLIAMTARVGGLRLFTTNATDFERIRAVKDFDLVVQST